MEKEIILGIITLIGVLTGQFFQSRKSSKDSKKLKNLVTEKDEKQDKALVYISNYIGEVKSAKVIKNKLRKKANDIIKANKLDNTEFLALLNNVKKIYAELMDEIINSDVCDTDIDDVETDMITAAKSLMNSVRWDKIDTTYYEDKLEKNFKNRLHREVVTPCITSFCMRLKDEVLQDEKKFNGTFSKIATGILSLLLIETIKVYRQCK